MLRFRNELQRILRPQSVLIIAILATLWYLTFTQGCNDSLIQTNYGYPYIVAKEYAQNYGASIDENEIEQIKEDYKEACQERDIVYQKYLGKYGINSYDDYTIYEEENFSKSNFNEIKEIATSGEVFESNFRPQTIEYLIQRFAQNQKEEEALENNSKEWFFSNASESAKLWLKKLLSLENEVSLLTLIQVDKNFSDYQSNWNLLILICCAILILPYLIKNTINHVTTLQYTSKKGKKIVKMQLGTALVSTTVIMIVLIGVFQYFYLRMDTSFLFDAKINLASHDTALWLDLTYLQYMIFSWFETWVMVICETIVLFWISYYSKNYITAIAISLPAILLGYYFLDWIHKTLLVFYYPNYCFGLCFGIVTGLIILGNLLIQRKAIQVDYVFH